MANAKLPSDSFSDEELELIRNDSEKWLRTHIWRYIDRFLATIAADRKIIKELEKFKKAVLCIGVEIVPVCMGCGKENCGDCPAGVTETVKNVKSIKQAATIERLRGTIEQVKIHIELHPDDWPKTVHDRLKEE